VNPCDDRKSQIVDLLYGLLSPEEQRLCRDHLASCAGCAAERDRLEAMMSALSVEEAFPRLDEVDWAAFARRTVRLAVEADAAPSGVARWLAGLGGMLRLPASPAWAAAAALLLIGTVAVTVYTVMPLIDSPEGPAGPAPAEVAMSPEGLDNLTVNLARQNTASYLRETQAVLVTLLDVNINCDKDKVDISAERAKATLLLRRQRLIADELNRLPLARAQDVCDDLERLLREISTLADCTRSDEIQTLRDVVDERQILVRMELLSQELERQRGRDA